jgi:hypothetical protein
MIINAEEWATSAVRVPPSEFVMTGECSCAKEMTIDGVVYGAEGHVSPGCVVHGWEAQTKERALFIPSVHPDETLEILETIRDRERRRKSIIAKSAVRHKGKFA